MTSRVPCSADPEMWYDPAFTADAKTVCAGCPVRVGCLTLALDNQEPWGVWGGLTENERARHTTGRPIDVCPGCGLLFVPRLPRDTRCETCTPPKRSGRVDDDLADIARLSADGWTARQIADHLGWQKWEIAACRQRHGIRYRQPRGGDVPADDKDLEPCGTPAACRRHSRRGEPIDEACRKAERRRGVDYKARRAKTLVAA